MATSAIFEGYAVIEWDLYERCTVEKIQGCSAWAMHIRWGAWYRSRGTRVVQYVGCCCIK